MTSVAEQLAIAPAPADHAAAAPVLWITGLAGVGKSTLARELAARLSWRRRAALLLDGDTVRAELDPALLAERHDLPARRRRAWRLAQMAHAASSRGQPVLVATISLFHDVQAWNRRHMPGYAELLLEAPYEALRQRRPDLYGPAPRPPHSPVVGVDLPAEFPQAAELRLLQSYSAESLRAHTAAASELWGRLLERQGIA
jgi:adenylylsulfate kinase-like enzyme